MCKSGILLIENQKSQYKEIRTKLCQDFKVFPEEKDFVKIADWARISLTKRYDYADQQPGVRRRNATTDLVNYINNAEIDVILLDHVLVGHHSGENGIHLAKKLMDKGIKQPIIFLSRTERNNENVKTDLQNEGIIDPIWIEKGYAGKGIGDVWYFKTNVVNEINKCMGPTIESMLDMIANSRENAKYIMTINMMRNKTFTVLKKRKLRDYCKLNIALRSEEDLINLIKELNNGE